jgi:hypothetical protein
MDGFGFLNALRGDPQMVQVPFIMLSARAGEEARCEGMEPDPRHKRVGNVTGYTAPTV